MTPGMNCVDREAFAALLFEGGERVTRRSTLNKRERHAITGPLWCEYAEDYELNLGEYLLLEGVQGKHFSVEKTFSLADVISFLDNV